MRGRRVLQTIHWKPPGRGVLRVLLPAGFFLLGTLIGFRCADRCDPSVQTALEAYLHDFCTVLEAGEVETSLLQGASLYFSYVLAVFLLGFSALGVVLIPVLSALFGFGTAFTVVCFVRTFARAGIFPAMALLSLRLIVTLIAFLMLAGEALPQSGRMARLALTQGRHREPVFEGRRYLMLFVFCAVLLLIGLCCERLITPLLFRLAMEKIS